MVRRSDACAYRHRAGVYSAIAVLITAVYLEIKKPVKSIGVVPLKACQWQSARIVVDGSAPCRGSLLGDWGWWNQKAIPGDRPWCITIMSTWPEKTRRECIDCKRRLSIQSAQVPSGHTTTSVGMAMVVTLLWRRRRVGFGSRLRYGLGR